MIELINIHKERQGSVLLNQINLKVEKGKVYGLIGSDHSRKSLLLQLMIGVVKPTDGTLKYFDEPFKIQHLERIGIATDSIDFYGQLTGLENIEQYLRQYSYVSKEEILHYFDRFDLLMSLHVPVKEYSSGMVQKLRLIRALVIKPQILILDEPIRALDPVASKILREELFDLSNTGMTMFIATSKLSFISDLADTIGVIHYGELINEINMHDKRQHHMYVDVKSKELPKMMMILERQLNIYDYEVVTDRILRIYGNTNNSEIIKVLIKNNIEVEAIKNGLRSLESFFLNAIGD